MTEHFEQIEAYLYGRLNQEALTAFEQAMANDPALADAVAQHRVEHLAMRHLYEQDLRRTLKTLKEKPMEAAPMEPVLAKRIPIWQNNKVRLAAAASVALIIAVWGIIPKNTPQKMFEDTVVSVRSVSRDIPPVLAPAYNYMAQKDYQAALAALNALDAETQTDYAWDIGNRRGECYFHLKNYQQAALQFETALKNPADRTASQTTEWNLLMTYWAAKDMGKAQQLRGQILSTPGHRFKDKAAKLF